MIVNCPSCTAKYKINSAKIQGRGAKITCPKCKHRFVVYRDEDGAEEEEDSARRVPANVATWDFRTLGLTWRVRRQSGVTYDFWDLQTLNSFLVEGQAEESDAITYDNRDWSVISEIDDMEEFFYEVWERAKRGEISIAAPEEEDEDEDDEDASDLPTTIMGKGSGMAAQLSSAVSEMRTPGPPMRESIPAAQPVLAPDHFEFEREPAQRGSDVEEIGTATAPHAPQREDAPGHGDTPDHAIVDDLPAPLGQPAPLGALQRTSPPPPNPTPELPPLTPNPLSGGKARRPAAAAPSEAKEPAKKPAKKEASRRVSPVLLVGVALIGLAILVGGGWAAYTFVYLPSQASGTDVAPDAEPAPVPPAPEPPPAPPEPEAEATDAPTGDPSREPAPAPAPEPRNDRRPRPAPAPAPVPAAAPAPAPEAAPEPAPAPPPQPAPEAAPEPAPEAAPEPAPAEAPAPEPAPGPAPEAAPEPAPEPAPEAAPEAPPEAPPPAGDGG